MKQQMPHEVMVQPLRAGDLRPLFPLMQADDRLLTWPRWRAYARRSLTAAAQPRHGILVARRLGHRLPCGAVCYRVDTELRFGTLLTAEHFVALDLLDPASVRAALAEGLERQARALGCAVIRALLPPCDTEAADQLCRAGHRAAGLVLLREWRERAL
ncbi:hypothetical protein [Acidisoma sp. C75]